MRIQKPSKYMAIGVKLRPMQAKGQLISYRGASCALAALAEGFAGRKLDEDDIDETVNEIDKAYPWMIEIVHCPVAICTERNCVSEIIAHLNDFHYWKRERIGEWLDKVAPKRKTSVRAKRAARIKPSVAPKRTAATVKPPGDVKRDAESPETTEAKEREEELVCV